jgi:hypothetical protein
MKLIDREDFTISRDYIIKRIEEKNKYISNDFLSFDIGTVTPLIDIITIPIIISITSNCMYDYLKNKVLSTLTKKELEDMKSQIIGTRLIDKTLEKSKELEEVKKVLNMFDFNNEEILDIISAIINKLVLRERK